MYYHECERCGGHLDPGERCDCLTEDQRAAQRLTYEAWEAAGDFEKVARPGMTVEERIVEEFRDALPPATIRANLLQAGEPYDHRLDPRTGHWKATYFTFAKRDGEWVYCGKCFIGETTEPFITGRLEMA